MVQDSEDLGGWFVLLLFGFCTAVFAIQLLPGAASLQLTPTGFCYRALFRSRAFVPWHTVSEFRVAKVASNPRVAYSTEAMAGSKLAPINRALIGETEALPDNYGYSAEELAKLLNEWRSRALEAASEQPHH